MRFLVTGGCGFIGSAAVRILVRAGHQVLNIDKLTYAGDLRTVAAVAGSQLPVRENRYPRSRKNLCFFWRLCAPSGLSSCRGDACGSLNRWPRKVPHLATGIILSRRKERAFGLFMCRQMKFTAVLATKGFSQKPQPIGQTRPIPRAKQEVIIWYEHGL
jgi:hypothetical protein